MSDVNSSLPVRTEANGDVAVRVVDGTITSQALNVDANGKVVAKLNDAAGNGLTSQLSGAQQALDVIDQADGPVTPGAVAAYSQLAGAQHNTVMPTLTDGQQAALQSDATGRLLASIISTDDKNYGVVGAATLRTAAQIGNATGAADFNVGASGAQTLRTVANLSDGAGAPISTSNPLPVIITNSPFGDHVGDFKEATAVAAAASDDHDYTVTAGKTLLVSQIESSASGKAKMEIKVETGVATGVFSLRGVQFNSTANPNMGIILSDPVSVPAGVRVRITMTNRDLSPQDLFSTILGTEI